MVIDSDDGSCSSLVRAAVVTRGVDLVDRGDGYSFQVLAEVLVT